MYIEKSDKMINSIEETRHTRIATESTKSPGNNPSKHQTNIVDCVYDASFRFP